MIPDLIDIGGPWKVLPWGIYDATLEEIRTRYATNEKRRVLFRGLENACQALKNANCKTVYLDGSYITEKTNPGDYDVCWATHNVDPSKLDPVFLDFTNLRKNQKDKYRGEFFPANAPADGSNTFMQYFQKDKATGLKKGIIRIQLQ